MYLWWSANLVLKPKNVENLSNVKNLLRKLETTWCIDLHLSRQYIPFSMNGNVRFFSPNSLIFDRQFEHFQLHACRLQDNPFAGHRHTFVCIEYMYNTYHCSTTTKITPIEWCRKYINNVDLLTRSNRVCIVHIVRYGAWKRTLKQDRSRQTHTHVHSD